MKKKPNNYYIGYNFNAGPGSLPERFPANTSRRGT